jgi:Leucine-rich repeat (LRR) protein
MAAGGELRPDDMLLHEGERKWVAAKAVKVLFPASAAPRKAVAPAAAPPAALGDGGLNLPQVSRRRAAPRGKSPAGLILVACGALALLLMVGGGVFLALPYLFPAKPNKVADAGRDKPAGADAGATKDDTPDGTTPPADGGRDGKFDNEFIGEGFYYAIILRPQQLIESPTLAALPWNKWLDDAVRSGSFDPRGLEQIEIYFDKPAAEQGNYASQLGFVFRATAREDGLRFHAPEHPVKEASHAGKTYFLTNTQTPGETTALHIVDERTIVSAAEPMLQKMLSGGGAKGPLAARLRCADLTKGITIVLLAEPIRPKIRESLTAAVKDLPPKFADVAKLDDVIDFATLTLNPDGDTLLDLSAEARDAGAARDALRLANAGLDLLKEAYATHKREVLEAVPADLRDSLDELIGKALEGVSATQDGASVVVRVKRPKGMPELVAKLAPLGEQLVQPGPNGGRNADEQKAIETIQRLGGAVIVDEGTPGKPVAGVDFTFPFAEVRDEDLACLKYFPDLQTAKLRFTRLTDAGLKVLTALKHLKVLYLGGTKVTDAGLKDVAALTGLTELQLDDTKVTDAGIKDLAALKGLQTLSLEYCQGVTDAGLTDLAALDGLQTLNLGRTSVSGPGLQHLNGLIKLRSLNLSGSKVTNAGLKHLAGLKGLNELYLACTAVTDPGLKELAALNKLDKLHLGTTFVTDAGLKELAALPSLQDLYLGSTNVTDAGLKELAALKRLQRLSLGSTRVTDAGLKDLAALTGLRSLDLGYNPKVTAAGLKELAALKELKELELATYATDEGLKEVAGLKGLESLDLSRSEVTDGGLKELAALKGLRSLNLLDCKGVTDVGLKELARLSGLRSLGLTGCKRVSDAGLRELAALKDLQEVTLYDTGVSDAGVADLQKALPQTTIKH